MQLPPVFFDGALSFERVLFLLRVFQLLQQRIVHGVDEQAFDDFRLVSIRQENSRHPRHSFEQHYYLAVMDVICVAVIADFGSPLNNS